MVLNAFTHDQTLTSLHHPSYFSFAKGYLVWKFSVSKVETNDTEGLKLRGDDEIGLRDRRNRDLPRTGSFSNLNLNLITPKDLAVSEKVKVIRPSVKALHDFLR